VERTRRGRKYFSRRRGTTVTGISEELVAVPVAAVSWGFI